MQPQCSSIRIPAVAADPNVIFSELFGEHRDRLYRFVLRHIGDSTEAEELAQQAFVEAARTFEQFRGESQLSTWLYGIAMNLVRNHLAARRRGCTASRTKARWMARPARRPIPSSNAT